MTLSVFHHFFWEGSAAPVATPLEPQVPGILAKPRGRPYLPGEVVHDEPWLPATVLDRPRGVVGAEDRGDLLGPPAPRPAHKPLVISELMVPVRPRRVIVDAVYPPASRPDLPPVEFGNEPATVIEVERPAGYEVPRSAPDAPVKTLTIEVAPPGRPRSRVVVAVPAEPTVEDDEAVAVALALAAWLML